MTPEPDPKNLPVESIPLTGPDPLLEHMKARQIPLTRKNYLDLAYPEGAPDPMPGELEALLPPGIRSY